MTVGKLQNFIKYRTFYVFVNATCFRSIIKASRIAKYFIYNGIVPVSSPKKADLIVIFTCGSFTFSEDNSIFTIERSLINKKSKIVITGCLTKIDPDRINRYINNAVILHRDNLSYITNLIGANFPFDETIYGDNEVSYVNDIYRKIPLRKIINNFTLIKYIGSNPNNKINLFYDFINNFFHYTFNTSSKAPYIIDIATGCLSKCSYCAIKLASGIFMSVKEELIIQRFKVGLFKKNKVFMLVAHDIGCYGFDINTSLPNLLKKLFLIKGDYRIILDGVNPRWLKSYCTFFINILKQNSEKIYSVNIPIQSASNKILKLMNRGYTIEEAKKCILDIKAKIPQINVETHILVGFPGETEDDFRETLSFISDLKFSLVTIFCYEDRPNTLALRMKEKNKNKIILKRAKLLATIINTQGGRAIIANP